MLCHFLILNYLSSTLFIVLLNNYFCIDQTETSSQNRGICKFCLEAAVWKTKDLATSFCWVTFRENICSLLCYSAFNNLQGWALNSGSLNSSCTGWWLVLTQVVNITDLDTTQSHWLKKKRNGNFKMTQVISFSLCVWVCSCLLFCRIALKYLVAI